MASNLPIGDIKERQERLRKLIAETDDALTRTLDELATDYGVTKARMSGKLTELGEAIPRPERNDRRQHVYPALIVYRALLADLDEISRERGQQASKLNGVMGGESSGDLSPRDIQQMVRAASEMFDLQRQQGLYIHKSKVDETVTGLFSIFAGSIMAIRARVDPNGQLPPAMSQMLEDFSRQLLSEVHKQASEYLDDDADVRPEPARQAQPRAARAIQRTASGRPEKHSSAAA